MNMNIKFYRPSPNEKFVPHEKDEDDEQKNDLIDLKTKLKTAISSCTYSYCFNSLSTFWPSFKAFARFRNFRTISDSILRVWAST